MTKHLINVLNIILIIIAISVIVVGVNQTQQYHLWQDEWQCKKTRTLHEVDADGNTKPISKCMQYTRI